ncbi:MAG: porphobilinogen synthase [Firmicutes bacterium]|nr:porphobilinogen synthase [Bacillota bacterium]
MFPQERPRRLRQSAGMRRLVRETRLDVERFIYPVFVRPGRGEQTAISAMPGIFQWSVDTLVNHCRSVYETGVHAFLLFGLPSHKDAVGSEAYDPEGIVQVALRALKEALPDAVLIADLCLCEYTDHGHCGILRGGTVDNDVTLDVLARAAVEQARAGATMVAPSDMMDGRVGAIRRALDENGFNHVPIMAYSAKYASGFYGPFREAADNAPAFGDRQTYQMDPGNRREALKEVLLDLAEGADIVMVKPALPYLDVLSDVRRSVEVPVAAYQVSGEFAMIEAAAQRGWLDRERVILETLISIRRAGADLIISYWAPEVSGWLGGLG